MNATKQSDWGFTLVEVVVSMLIITIALVPMMELFTGSRLNFGQATTATAALFLAQEKMEELAAQGPKNITSNSDHWEEFSGFPGYRYQVRVSLKDQDLELYNVTVKVQYTVNGRGKEILLSTYSSPR